VYTYLLTPQFPNARERSTERILFSFENNCSESVEQGTELLTERIKEGESKGYEGGAAGVDAWEVFGILRGDVISNLSNVMCIFYLEIC
jgi:hypothetical protein